MLNITGFNPKTGAWNDSLTGDFLWDNTNIGEAIPNVMTPFTWSIFSIAYSQLNIIPGYHTVGNICGRPYQNGSVMYALIMALGRNPEEMVEEIGGGLDFPEGLTIPFISVPWQQKFAIASRAIQMQIKNQRALRGIPKFLEENAAWCQNMHRRIQLIESPEDFERLWEELTPFTVRAFRQVVSTVWKNIDVVAKLRRELEPMIGADDIKILISASGQSGKLLASVAPVASISKVARGEMTRTSFLEQYGHRGPYEGELSVPRPAEDPAWIDQQIAALEESAINVDEMLARQQSEYNAAWQRFIKKHPKKMSSFQRKLARASDIQHIREAARSEAVRMLWVTRALALRAGAITGVGADVFHLTFEEMVELVIGNTEAVQYIPARKETYQKYCTLPPLPRLISGQFEAFAWAADPQRRNDYFDSHSSKRIAVNDQEPSTIIKGNAGSLGIYEGLVRIVPTAEEGHLLQVGEILVANQTNVGWTMLFPRAGAVVTDVGAVLSHAAIVARELGIPAVVGCGDATTKLKTGDRVRVDGARGIVEIIRRAT